MFLGYKCIFWTPEGYLWTPLLETGKVNNDSVQWTEKVKWHSAVTLLVIKAVFFHFWSVKKKKKTPVT